MGLSRLRVITEKGFEGCKPEISIVKNCTIFGAHLTPQWMIDFDGFYLGIVLGLWDFLFFGNLYYLMM